MKKCEKCSNQFTWKEIIKSIWIRSYGSIVCDSCNTEHQVAPITRLIIALSIALPPLIFNSLFILRLLKFNLSNPFEAIISGIAVYLIWIILMMCITPFYARYKLKINNKSDM
ncbi:TIGR04104 family putative zinc finger protein [Clostridium sp.]|uniref:TIGR04104 family putative zinc finger protein n=1 Tax=Clostridium sp. TaxID=1506 RepID=UPI003D6D4CFE